MPLSVAIYKAISDYCNYGFKDYITRCGLSAPSDIAKGLKWLSDRETARF